MNKKNAETHLSSKFNKFLKSIDDDSLKKEIRNNSIICGGAITSLLLGEKVNDYDVYFTNKNVTKKVANYFVNKYKNSFPSGKNTYSGEITVDETPDERIVIKVQSSGVSSHKDSENEYQYFEGTEENEAEDYLKNITDLDEINNKYLDLLKKKKENESSEEKEEEKFIPLMLTQNAITLSDDFQLIIRFYGSPKEIHEKFDYEHTKMHFNVGTSTLHTKKQALESILARELYYTGSKYPICSLFRMRKYINRGWIINAGQIFKMAYQVSELDLSNLQTLEDQLIGVDTAYFIELIGLIKEEQEKSDSKELDSTYIMSLVDKIF